VITSIVKLTNFYLNVQLNLRDNILKTIHAVDTRETIWFT